MSDIGKNRVDITGKVYGHLTARCLTEKVKGNRSRQWIVDCKACDGTGKFTAATLRAGMVTSCGCKPRLNLRGFNLVKRMRTSGQRLCKSLPASASANPEVRFFLEPSGRTVHKLAAESAIAAHELSPLGDGLFADQSQTWVAA
jgi:hypothetical protein